MNEEWDTGAIEVTDERVGRRARTHSRARVQPKPSKVWASLFRTLAWMGSIVTLALVVPTITAHDLLVQGGLATAVGRVTGMLGTYLLLVTRAARRPHTGGRTGPRPGHARAPGTADSDPGSSASSSRTRCSSPWATRRA